MTLGLPIKVEFSELPGDIPVEKFKYNNTERDNTAIKK
jgi:hypothetical protein